MITYIGASTLLGFGVSNKENTLPNLLSRYYNTNINLIATPAASNDFIFRQVYNLIKCSKPLLLIITWQTWEREEWEHNGTYYQVSAGENINNYPFELRDKVKQWISEYDQNVVASRGKIVHDKIYELHQTLKQKEISHLFYNEMYPFDSAYQVEWNQNFIGPYTNDLSYYWYLKNCGLTTDKWYHYGDDGHQLWAKFLIEHIENYDLIR